MCHISYSAGWHVSLGLLSKQLQPTRPYYNVHKENLAK